MKLNTTALLNVSHSTIYRLWNRYRQQGSIRDPTRSGRPIVTTAAQDLHIRLYHLRERCTTASFTASAIPGELKISDQTIRNRLRDTGQDAQ